MAVVKRTFKAKLILTLLRSGSKKFNDSDVALAMLEAEQAVNNLILQPIEDGIQPYVRLHVGVEDEGSTEDADNQD